MQQPDGGEVALGTGQFSAGKPGHEGAGSNAEALGELAHRGRVGSEADHRLEEEPGIGRHVPEGGQHRSLDPGHGPGHRLGQELPRCAQPVGAVTSMTRLTPLAPSSSRVSVARGPYCDTSAHGGHAGKFADQVRHAIHLLRPACCTDSSTASIGRSRTMRMASEIDSRCRMATQPVPAASTRERSPGESMAATVGAPAASEGAGSKHDGPWL